MIPQLNYNDITVLTQLALTKNSLQEYLSIVGEMMKNQYPNYPFAMDFNIDDEKYVFVQKGNNFSIETGFFWDVQDLYFGIKIIVPYIIDDIDLMPIDYNWSYGVEGEQNSYLQLIRYADLMVVGCTAEEYIDVLQKFKEIAEASNEVVRIAEKYSVSK